MLPLPIPPVPLPNTGSQLDRAIAAWLIANGAGAATDVLPATGVTPKYYPCTIIIARRSTQEPELTGNDMWDVEIMVKGSAASEGNEPNPAFRRVQLDQRLGLTKACLLQGYIASSGRAADQANLTFTAQQITAWGNNLAGPGDGSPQALQDQANNADMNDFTCMGWYYRGQSRGDPNEEGCSWVEILHFQARVAGIALT